MSSPDIVDTKERSIFLFFDYGLGTVAVLLEQFVFHGKI